MKEWNEELSQKEKELEEWQEDLYEKQEELIYKKQGKKLYKPITDVSKENPD